MSCGILLCFDEHPNAIVSDRQLEMVSFPLVEHMKSFVIHINRALHAQSNMIGRINVPSNELEITAGFAGPEGNLIWLNTGGCDLLLRLCTGTESQSIIIEKGFGFCLGKKEKITRAFLSYVNRAVDKFDENVTTEMKPYALFFG